MATLFEQYYGNLLADLSYVDFNLEVSSTGVLGGDLLIAQIEASDRFTLDQAEAIADRFEIVATADEGFFQTVAFRELPLAGARDGMPAEPEGYGRSPGRIWVAFRGTFGAGDDLLGDFRTS